MVLRIVQAGSGERRDVVCVYFLASQNDGALRRAAPNACIVNDTRSNPAEYAVVGTAGIKPLDGLVSDLEHELGFKASSITLVGWSAGCKGPRSQLLKTHVRTVDAIVVADGTAANYPVPDAKTQLLPWQEFAQDAADGYTVFIGTHTMLTYTEHLPNPFMSTWRVLQLVTGFKLDKQGPNDSPVVTRKGNLIVWSYLAASAAGHVFQGQQALPAALAQAITLVRAGLRRGTNPVSEAPPDTKPSGEVMMAWRDPALTLGQRSLAWMMAMKGQGKGEEPRGSNAGPFIRECFVPCVRDGVGKLGLTAGNWCAASCCAAEANARLEGDSTPVHEYRCSGFELEVDAKRSGAWRSAKDWRVSAATIDPGDIVIFNHGTAAEPWRRHVTRFVGWSNIIAGKFTTIGGNEGVGEIQVTARDINDPTISGFIGLPHRDPTIAQQAAVEAAAVNQYVSDIDLSSSVMRGQDDLAAILASIDARRDGAPKG